MRKLVMSMVLMTGLAFSAQAVQPHNFNLNGPGGWGDANLTAYVNNHLDAELTYLGRVESNFENAAWEGNIVAYVLKGGNQGGWLFYNTDLVPFENFSSGVDMKLPSGQDVSFLAVFGNAPSRSVPEPSSALALGLTALLGFGLFRKRMS